MHDEANQRLKELAAEAANEQDPERLLNLIQEINKLVLEGQPEATKPSDAEPASEPEVSPPNS